jgi:ubiquinone/menaquinone biosynthesis C-methylase UbiE
LSAGRFVVVTRHPRAGREVAALGGGRRFAGKHVLEIGAGNGRVTFDLGRLARRVVAVEPQPEAAAQARDRCAQLRLRNVEFRVADAVHLDLGRARFDIALFTWSL